MQRSARVLLGLASLVLVVVVWLAFHDIAETHTVRDWLTLLAAGMVWSAALLSLRRVRAQHPVTTGLSGT
jgi:hypothetical protein